MQKKIKIAISATGFIEWHGGIDFLKGIIRMLLQKDNDFYLLLPSFSLKNYPKILVKNFRSILKLYNQIFPAKENPEIEEIFEEFKGKVKFVYHNGNILKTINKIKPDIIYPTWDMLFNKTDIPQVAYLYDCQHKYFPQNFKKHSIKSRDKYFQKVVNNYKAIIVASENAKNDLIKFYHANPEHIFRIEENLNINSTYLDKIDYNIKEKYNLPEEYFIICSQFWQHKSHITAFEAVKKLKDKGINVFIVCTGKQEDYRHPMHIQNLFKKIEEWGIQDNIRTLGMVEKKEQIELIRNAKALIQPSLFEGGAGAGGVREALILARPIIMSDIAINKEYEDKENISYFTAKDADSLSKNMQILLNSEIKNCSNEELIEISKERSKLTVEKIYAPIDKLLNL